MAHTVIGIFDNASEAQTAVDQLVNKGFNRSNIDLSAGTNSDMTNSSSSQTQEFVDDTKDTGSGIGHFFSSLFGSDDDEDTKKYATVANQGSIVTVHADTDKDAERAADLLDEAGAVDVNERAAEYGYVSTSATPMSTTTTPVTSTNGDQTIQVIEENLEVGKRMVETGGVRLRSRIVAKPVEESIRLRQERVTVNRTPVNRAATAADLNAFQDGQIELTEHAEVPVVSKTANVVEEISVGKTVNERDEVIRDTVRKTEVDVENLGSTDQTIGNRSTDLDTNGDVTYSTK